MSKKRIKMSEKRNQGGDRVQIDKQTMRKLAEIITDSVVAALEQKKLLETAEKSKIENKSAYAKTEALLYSFNGFKRIINERMQEIEDIKKYGVPQTCGAGGERVQNGNLPHGLVLPEESVEAAVRRVQTSVQDTVQAVALIEKCMAALKNDPYYQVLELRYFEGRTQEDIALRFGCSQVTISKNKSRLVRELSMRLFPNQVISEMLN